MDNVVKHLVERIDALAEENLHLRLQVGGCDPQVAEAIMADVKAMREAARHALWKARGAFRDLLAEQKARETAERKIARLSSALAEN